MHDKLRLLFNSKGKEAHFMIKRDFIAVTSDYLADLCGQIRDTRSAPVAC
jgi:hypothetical protein